MKKTRIDLKSTYITGYKPTQQDYTNVFDSFQHVDDALTAAGVLDVLTNATLSDLRAALHGVYWQHPGMLFIVDGASAEATDNRVDAGVVNSSIPYKTIGAALSAASATFSINGQNPTVIVMPGYYAENVNQFISGPFNLIYNGVNHVAVGNNATALHVSANNTPGAIVLINSTVANVGTATGGDPYPALSFVGCASATIQGVGRSKINSIDGPALYVQSNPMVIRDLDMISVNGKGLYTYYSPIEAYRCSITSTAGVGIGGPTMNGLLLDQCTVSAYSDGLLWGGSISGLIRILNSSITSVNSWAINGGSIGNNPFEEDWIRYSMLKGKLGIMMQGIGGTSLTYKLRLERNTFEVTNPAMAYAFNIGDAAGCVLDTYANRSNLALFMNAPLNTTVISNSDYINANTKVNPIRW